MPTQQDARERDILLAPNEYAYVQDLTKGAIDLNVGPTKVSLSNTERIVEYDPGRGRFVPLEGRLSHDDSETANMGVKQFVAASSSQYIVLGNPAKDDVKYVRGSNQSTDLRTGKKVVIPGPATFPLWPGQTANVIDGHRLAEDEYLLIRAYDTPDAAATKSSGKDSGAGKDGSTPEANPSAVSAGEVKAGKIQIGTERIVRGSETRFYIPSDGFEVVPVDDGSFVRKAVKLMDGEYCVLIKPDGKKKYVTGPNMVIPEPNENFMNSSSPVSRAQTLRPERGLHLCVIKDFEVKEGDELAKSVSPGKYTTGQEIFIQGKDGLFFPNENIQIKQEVKPVSLAENEGIYVRNIKTGEISTVSGPKNFLPDPTKSEIVERTLEEKLRALYKVGSSGDRRKAVSVYVPPNHAVMITSEKERKVVRGPRTEILGYSENLETLALSTGTPKSDKALLPTVFLQVEGNKVSDEVRVETQDHVKLDVKVSYRLSFEDKPEKWFNVNNYVGLLCDHLSSLVRSAVQRHPLEKFYSGSTEIIREAVLGIKKEGERRHGRIFDENGMKVYDLEVLNIGVLDERVEEILSSAQQNAFSMEMSRREAERRFELTKSTEAITQQTNAIKMESMKSQLALTEEEEKMKSAQARLGVGIDRISQLGKAESGVAAQRVAYEFERTRQNEEQARRLQLTQAETDAFKARMEAVSPDLITAITRYGDQQLITNAAEHVGKLAVLEGKSVQEILVNLFQGLPFATRNLKEILNSAAPSPKDKE